MLVSQTSSQPLTAQVTSAYHWSCLLLSRGKHRHTHTKKGTTSLINAILGSHVHIYKPEIHLLPGLIGGLDPINLLWVEAFCWFSQSSVLAWLAFASDQ